MSKTNSNLLLTLTEERRQNLIKEIYLDPPSPGPPTPPEVVELMKVFDWQENESETQKPVLDFDELAIPFRSFNDFMNIKRNCIASYL